MIIYLAARYSRHEYMRAIRTSLQMKGHTVTSRWIEAPEGKYGRGSFTREQLDADPGYCAGVALRDLQDIAAAGMLICFTEQDGGGKGGRHAELGYALAARRYGKPIRIVVVGPREHVFQTAPGTEWYPDWDTLCAEASWLYVAAANYDELMRWHAREGGVH